jgi:hypothetical protein
MRREAFQTFLVKRYRGKHSGRPLMDDSARSYCANLARAEETLRVNFDNADLSTAGLDAVSRKLRASRLPPPKAGDCFSAIQAYAQFLGDRPGGAAIGPTAFATDEPGLAFAAARRSPAIPRPAATPVATPDPLVAHMSVKGLLMMHGAIGDELLRRGVVRTANNPGGDFAETLYSRAFGWTLAGNSALGYDAADAEGLRYQIKARRITARNGSRQLSSLRRLPERQFDFLAGVLFEPDYSVRRAVIVPHAQVEALSQFIAHTNGWRFMLEDRVWDLPEARDVTAELRAAADAM